jgi:hypothetical protein
MVGLSSPPTALAELLIDSFSSVEPSSLFLRSNQDKHSS